jgi:hypothetical protein
MRKFLFIFLILPNFIFASEEAKMEKLKGPQPLDVSVTYIVASAKGGREEKVLKSESKKVIFLLGHDQPNFKSYIWEYKVDDELDFSATLVGKSTNESSFLWKLNGHLMQKHNRRRFPVCGFRYVAKSLAEFDILKETVEENCYKISGDSQLRYSVSISVGNDKK